MVVLAQELVLVLVELAQVVLKRALRSEKKEA